MGAGCAGIVPLPARLEPWQVDLCGNAVQLAALVDRFGSPLNVIHPAPLARNAATHSQNELTAKEESHNDDALEFEVQDLSVPATAKEEVRAEENEPIFETHLIDGQADLAAHLFRA